MIAYRHRTSDPVDVFEFRLFPVLVAVNVIAVAALTDIEITFLPGAVLHLASVAYAAALVAAAASPARTLWVHQPGAVVAVAVFGGRAIGFLETAILEQMPNLYAAAIERTLILAALLIWHRRMIIYVTAVALPPVTLPGLVE